MSGLKTYDLKIGYSPDKLLAQDVNLKFEKGALIGLVGQNGVGKSTLIRTLCGFHAPLSGHIELASANLSELHRAEIAKKVSVVLTGKPESLNLTVLEVISLGRYPHSGWLGLMGKDDQLKVEEAISQMEIDYIATKRLFELSDGQLQKVMIARALAQDTDLIILDEPTSHLDLRNKIEVLQLLKKVSEANKGVLISTHEVQLAAQVCDLFWCMDFQKELLVQAPRELIQSGKLQEYLHLQADAAIKFQL